MAEYSRLASGQVVSTGGATSVIIPFIPNFIEISNAARAGVGAGVTRAWWETDMGQGAAFLTTVAAGSNLDTFVSSGGFSTFQGGIALQYGTIVQHGGSPVSDFQISKASPALVTTVGNHGLVSGDVIVFQNLFQTATTGMPQIAGIPFVVTVTAPTTFTIPWNTGGSNYTAFNTATSTGNIGSYKQLLYPNLYAPGLSFITAITLGATTTIDTTAPHNYVVGQEVAFRIPPLFGTTQLNSLPNILIPGSPVYGFVTAVNSATEFVVNINSTAYSAFVVNNTVSAVKAGGFSFPQVVAVGDANSGSLLTNFVSPSFYNGTSTSAVQTINGPAVAGAFCNNTSQGFIIGSAVAGTAADVLYWRAYMHDLSL